MLLILLSLVSLALLTIQKCFQAPGWLQGANWALMPLLVIYATLFLASYQAWIITFIIGVLIDLFSESRLGSSTACLLAVVMLLQTQYLERWRKQWYAQMFLALVGTMFFLILDYLSFSLQRGRFVYSEGILFKMTMASLFNALLAPFFFALLNLGFTKVGCKLSQDSLYEEQEGT